LDVQKMRVNLY